MKHLESQFKGVDGLNLYYQCWLPDAEPKAILLVVHGLAEHSGRYGNLVNYLVPRGYGIYSYDQRGHGKSDGLKGYVDSFSNFVNDLDIFRSIIHQRQGQVKIMLLGHSLGAIVAISYAILHQDKLDGLILSGTLLSTPASVKAGTILLARLLAIILPRAGLYIVDAEAISRDKSVVKAYTGDPLVYRGKIRARLGVEIMKAMNSVKPQTSQIHLPLLVMHGTADRLSAPKDSEFIYGEARSGDKTLKFYEGYFHEIFNEPNSGQVLADVTSWLIAREQPS